MTHDLAGTRRLESALTLSARNEISGFVYDANDLSTRFVVELLADGLPIGLYRADGFVDSLCREAIGDGCYGFATVPPEAVALGAGVLDARLANSGEAVGSVLRPASSKGRLDAGRTSHVRWTAGLRFEGWLESAPDHPPRHVKALIDGRLAAEATANGWIEIGHKGASRVGRRFVLDLPLRYADGKAHEAAFLSSDGTPLMGSPCAFLAFENGLEALIDRHADLESERVRARALDRLHPQAWPFMDSARWQSRFPSPRPDAAEGPAVAVVLIGEAEAEVDISLSSLQAQIHCTWTAACLPAKERATSFEPVDLGGFLESEAAASDIIVFAPAGTRFDPGALGLFRDALAAHPSAHSAYCDLMMPDPSGAWPMALPAFDYERCLEQGYCGLVFAMRRAVVTEAVSAGAESLIRLFQTQLDAPLASGAEPLHLPLFLAHPPAIDPADLRALLAEAVTTHFRLRRVAARVSGRTGTPFPMIRVTRPIDPGRVSIIIPTRNGGDLLTACLTSIEATLSDETECEVIIADNGSTEAEALAVMASAARQGIRIVPVPGPFNFSRINNQAAAHATGRYLLFLNNDVEALEPGWLEEMLSRIAEPDVGAVGPLLLWPSGIVQHGGIVLGPGFGAARAFDDRLVGDPGYGGLLHGAHECSALSGACLLTRRDLFLAQGGFDPVRFAVDFNDVDYCLKLRAAGYRIVMTPDAKVRHAECSTRGRYERPDQDARQARERDGLRAKWGEVLADDPYYNPSLTLGGPPYSGLSWPPRAREPRQPHGRRGRDLPPGL